jgi:hypothetical protein
MNRNLVGSIYGKFCIKFPQSRILCTIRSIFYGPVNNIMSWKLPLKYSIWLYSLSILDEHLSDGGYSRNVSSTLVGCLQIIGQMMPTKMWTGSWNYMYLPIAMQSVPIMTKYNKNVDI